MKLVLEAKEFDVDAWLHDYVRTTVVFAIWHREVDVDLVHVRLDRAGGDDGAAYVRCSIRAEIPTRGPVASGATGPDVAAAVQQASDLLEVALLRLPSDAVPAAPHRLAA